MAKSLALLCSCLALALVPVACGDDEEEESGGGGGGSQAQPEDKAGDGGGAAKKREEVAMIDTTFEPADVTIVKGGTVEWGNVDGIGHDVTKNSGPGPDFKSGEPGGMAQGDTFKQTFNTPGKVEYVCSVHSGMEGTVTVK
jgi:plastocyanin